MIYKKSRCIEAVDIEYLLQNYLVKHIIIGNDFYNST